MTLTETLIKLFNRDLANLEKEILSYESEEAIWITREGIKNSSGNLCLHICGNLQHYIGAVLGHTGYKRNRDAEFTSIGLSKKQLLLEIETTRLAVTSTLNTLTHESVTSIYPEQVFGQPMETEFFLIHLQGHLNYHLGQINYNRRINTMPLK